MFTKVLIANRGEIAIRVMRACREMGIATVAVYSEADRRARHVRYADEAFPVGPAAASESYLQIDRVVEVALRSGAEAVHPGYGFLAENPQFARRVNDEGLTFIGPAPDSIALLGDKMEARQCMSKAGIPLVPGIEKPVSDMKTARSIAGEIGYPVLLKAAAGGGGKGMRVVEKEDELERSFNLARSEAKSAFGDDRIYIEKYVEQPRHVEIQIMADGKGNIVHLGERECSIQRRHQKVVEESPCPIVDSDMRERMGATAIKAAKSADYLNAGTVEFLVDKNKDFYFLEVNTRLQVEHPVTEMVTGIDLAQEQILVAAGHPLSFEQKDVSWRGSAIECRVYAEDPDSNFMPSIGTIGAYREPGGPGVRVDSGLMAGDEVSLYYDPMIAKLIAWGADREVAIERMRRALEEYVITGVKTVIPFHIQVMNHPRFRSGDISTHFIAEEGPTLSQTAGMDRSDLADLSIVASVHDLRAAKRGGSRARRPEKSRWKSETRRRNILGS